MPGCAAIGCNNRSEKGYVMKCFPRDPQLRKIWQDRVARADWEPSNNSFLCHIHFEPEEWSITQSGRVRLRRNAIPSIFTVTSTRKSTKKRIKLANMENKNECENDYMTESLENDTEYSSIDHLGGKDSDSQDTNNSSIQSPVHQQANHSVKKIETTHTSYEQYIGITNDLRRENIILDDNNMEIECNTKENAPEKQGSMETKTLDGNFIAKRNPIDNQSENVVKTEIKPDIYQTFDDSYDEIEEKLKQICDGHREEKNISNMEKLNSISKNRKGSLEESMTQLPFHKSINYKYSPKNEIGNIFTDNRDNIEIIFGSESGEEFARVPRYTFYNTGTNEIDKLSTNHQLTTNADGIINSNEEIGETCAEYIEASSRENAHAAPNTRTAIKCKQKTREEVVESIKRSVQNEFFQDTNSMSNSDTSDVDVIENETKKELNRSEIARYNKDDATSDTTKFMVKLTGDREDVFDIMQDLFKNTKDYTIHEHNDTRLQQENNASVTSIITIDDCPMETNSTNKCNADIFSPSIISRNNDQIFALSSLKDDECMTTRLLSSHTDEEKDSDVNVIIEQSTTIDSKKYEYEKLQQKVKLQETVINQLTNQLILLKDKENNLEKKSQNKDMLLRPRIKKIEKMNKLNKSMDDTPPSTNLRQTDKTQRFIYDLSNRMHSVEEMNKKLMKTVTIECQQKRKLESQIKQKDKRIKELNWKLEKASKYVERAEKNTNTYKRKMLNMQTAMRRKKLLNRTANRFHELMMDSAKENYSEEVVAMAIEIKEICGTNGYKKLLNFGFPFPTLSVLHTLTNRRASNKSSNKIQRVTSLKQNLEEDEPIMKNDGKVDTKIVERATSLCEEIIIESTETITGTVQDIFEESNDDVDDFSTNELRDHFILQLNAVM